MSEKKKINQNMLRERANKVDIISDEMWKEVNEQNRFIVDEYFESSQELSKETIKQYASGLRIFFYWVKEKVKNKPLYEIKKSDFIKYRSYLINRGLSSKALNLKKSAVSSLCNFIENIFCEENEEYDNFRNFTRGLPPLPKNQVYDKIKVTEEDYHLMMDTLEKEKNYLGMAWTAVAMQMGGRRSELVQLKSEIVDYPYQINSKGEIKKYRYSHIVKGKGRGRDGKPLKFMINDEAIKYMKLWLDNRGYEHEYIFTTKYKGEFRALSKTWANEFCKNKLSQIVGRRINPHLFKASCITFLLEQGHDMKTVSKHIAHHDSVETTAIYDLRTDEDEKDGIY